MNSSNSYDLIAREYYLPRHVTSRNFDIATRSYLEIRGCKLPSHGPILEIGAGRGNASSYCGINPDRVTQADTSLGMLLVSPRDPCIARVSADGLTLPFRNGVFKAVVAFLYDPFNMPHLYHELARVLEPGGAFLGSLPNYEWGKSLRQLRGYSIDKARLITASGEMIERDSHLMSGREIESHLRQAGFGNVEIADASLPHGDYTISTDVIDPAREVGASPFDIPLLTIVRSWK